MKREKGRVKKKRHKRRVGKGKTPLEVFSRQTTLLCRSYRLQAMRLRKANV